MLSSFSLCSDISSVKLGRGCNHLPHKPWFWENETRYCHCSSQWPVWSYWMTDKIASIWWGNCLNYCLEIILPNSMQHTEILNSINLSCVVYAFFSHIFFLKCQTQSILCEIGTILWFCTLRVTSYLNWWVSSVGLTFGFPYIVFGPLYSHCNFHPGKKKCSQD